MKDLHGLPMNRLAEFIKLPEDVTEVAHEPLHGLLVICLQAGHVWHVRQPELAVLGQAQPRQRGRTRRSDRRGRASCIYLPAGRQACLVEGCLELRRGQRLSAEPVMPAQPGEEGVGPRRGGGQPGTRQGKLPGRDAISADYALADTSSGMGNHHNKDGTTSMSSVVKWQPGSTICSG